jgi:cytochrome c553
MSQRLGSILLVVVFLLSSMSLVMASGGAKGNARKGKYLFRKHCRACHKEGATGDRVGKPLSPISKTQADWKKVFDEKDKLACKDVWAAQSEQDLLDIFTYLHDHAYDSPSPAKCE